MNQTIYRLRIDLLHIKPPIWRRIEVPAGFTLGQLHEICQIAMGWLDEHLHQFLLELPKIKSNKRKEDLQFYTDRIARLDARRFFVPRTTPYGEPMEMDGENENAVKLGEVLPQIKRKISYFYDFGDDWHHEIKLEKIEHRSDDDRTYPVCLAGKRACPPEDSGGPYGYGQRLFAFGDPKDDYHEDAMDWLGPDFDPDFFDLKKTNNLLAQWGKSQSGPNLRLTDNWE